jgi:hypothetical protein
VRKNAAEDGEQKNDISEHGDLRSLGCGHEVRAQEACHPQFSVFLGGWVNSVLGCHMQVGGFR